jgi:trans-aconitate methyltransferase
VIVGERLHVGSAPDVRARHVARYRRAIELAGPRVGTWWDVASGDGYGTKMMPSVHRAGFDRDPEALAHARATVPRANFWEVDLRGPYWWVPEPSRPNVVLCIETLEHLPVDVQPRLMADFAKVLRPAGVLVLACPIGNGPSEVNPWHLHEPPLDELRALLRAHFVRVDTHTEDYVSTSGPATQAFCVCYGA